jgi:hypothetical protein
MFGPVAAHRGQRPVQRPDHLRNRDVGGRSGQPVAALGATPAGHDLRLAELAQDRLEEPRRISCAFADVLR